MADSETHQAEGIAILGAGVTGLCCALRLQEIGIPCTIYEGSDRVGGRVATDEVDGFLLDRGFQVLLSAYPEVQARLDLKQLSTTSFESGSLVRSEGKVHHIADGFRQPLRGLRSLLTPIVKFSDPLAVAGMRRLATRYVDGHTPDENSFRNLSIREFLAQSGVSDPLRSRFFEPFFRGITLDSELSVPAWWFLEVFGMFARGEAMLPQRGMQAIPMQLAENLRDGTIQFGKRAESVEGLSASGQPVSIEFQDGTRVQASRAIVAVDGPSAHSLLGSALDSAPPQSFGTTTVYYAADSSPLNRPILMLGGDGLPDGRVNHVCVPSDVQSSYAPAGKSLISATIVGASEDQDDDLDRAVRDQLSGWFGESTVQGWTHLRTYRIPHALPRAGVRPGGGTHPAQDRILACGDYLSAPSLQGAMAAGRAAAETVAAQLAMAPTTA